MKTKRLFAIVLSVFLSFSLWAQDGTFTTDSGIRVTMEREGSGPTLATGQEFEMNVVYKDPQGKVLFDSRELGFPVHDVVASDDDKLTKAAYEVLTSCRKGDKVRASIPKTLLDAGDPVQKIDGSTVTLEIELLDFYDAKPNAADLIESTIKAAGVDAGKAVFEGLRVRNPEDYKFHQFDFNELGYDFLAEKAVDASIEVFKMNTALYPESANAFDSLGDAWSAAGKKEEAIACYEEALKLNPDFSASRKKLDELKKN